MKKFESILHQLKERGIPILKSKYEEQVFGSWYIVIDSTPNYRIVHDGRDKTIVLEKMKDSEWDSIIADKTQSGKHVFEKLISELGGL